jgi:myo-inositol 2-dehydrogenase/D-chiro-inositol 1-dehydrogenase/scyllo-inositol 2-dehydrogenase (NAD+)
MKGLVNRTRRGELVAICDANRDVLDKVGDEYGIGVRYTDYREAVADLNVEAVIIVTPCYLHREVACAAAEQGKHILLEKPMAMNVAECETIRAAAEQNGVKLQMGFMRRFDEGFLRAKEIVDSGELGRVMKVNSTGRGPGLPPPWIYDLSKSNGILAEVNSHDFDSVRWFSGSEIVRIYAEGANFKCPDAKQEFPDFYDNAIVSLRFANGTLGVIDGTCPCHYGYDARVEILCEMGVVFVGSSIKEGVTRVKVDDAQVTGVGTGYSDTVWSWRTLFRDAYVAEVEHFADCIREDKQPSVTGYDGLKAVEAVCAANQSILSGKPVELPGKTE